MNRDFEKDHLNEKIERAAVFNKILKYCSYQERSEHDAVERLKKYGLGSREIRKMIMKLKEEKFIDDQRYAQIFTLGKLRINKWGRIRIRIELKRKKIDEGHIESAFGSIEEAEYSYIILDLIRKKKENLRQDDPYVVRNKVARYLLSKGFENDLVWSLIAEEIP